MRKIEMNSVLCGVPQCPTSEKWSYQDWYQRPQEPASTVMSLIDSLTSLQLVDNTRVYVMGLSMGGYGTWYLITRFPDKFAAAVPTCGGGDWTQASNFVHVPIWAFHGSKDDIVSPDQSRQMINILKNLEANPSTPNTKK